jgi:hypothetical protein
MSLLSTVAKPAPRPPIITVVGEAGTGKSSFAATFPKPIFIRVEDGVGRISRKIETPDAFPVVTSSDALFDQIMALIKEDHDYSTLVVDSVTKLEELFTREIIEKDGRAKTLSTALGGYGAGYQALAGMHHRVRKAAGALNEKRQMAIIFIAHADLETMRLPDTDDYQRHSLRLNSKSIAPYVDDVDVVGFVRLAAALRGDDGERKKVVSTGDREFVCHATAASVSKNGLGITSPLPFPEGTNPLADALGITQRMKPKAEKAEQKEIAE